MNVTATKWATYQKWTPADDARLRELYPAVGATETAKLMGRTRASVKSRVIAVGIRGTFNRVRFWTPERDALVRASYRAGAVKGIAADLGVSASAVKQRARKLGLDSGRRRQARELEAVAEMYATRTAEEISLELYGTPDRVSRVRRMAEVQGLKKWPSWPADVLARVSELNTAGHCDRAIAAAMADVFKPGDRGRDQVKNIRQRLGLPLVPDADAKRRSVAKQCETMGVTNPNQIKVKRHRQVAASYGLPAELLLRQVQIVLTLASGPKTTADLAAAGCANGVHNGNCKEGRRRGGSTYLSDLVRRGLVARVSNRMAFGGTGPKWTYVLTPACMAFLTSEKETA